MLRGFLDLMAKMGLSMREDPPKVVDLTVRSWGESEGGLVLSIHPIPRADSDALPGLSVVIRNVGTDRKSISIPGWLFFFSVEVRSTDGAAIPISPFGAQLMRPERRTEQFDITLGPGEFADTEIPIGSMFGLRPRTRYLVRASCDADGIALRSNEITV